ncbi:putative bifunctional diguanylate cyclase/phosphodiesterase [Baaleninema sp.]|uniref:putative bifunctional diguanylate cyclase/phosphodiesterase n=1 Tax=Baaleninema sp. TaxID=3101197 RepID=UPI003D089B57
MRFDRPEDYLQAGDTAMHRAQLSKRHRDCLTFTPAWQEEARRRIELDTALRRALERREFQLHYQPIFELESRQLVGFEALVRWYSPQRGLVSPNEFVPLAEETGLIVILGEWILEEACWQLRDWQLRFGWPRLSLSVNVAAVQLTQPGFVELVDRLLRETEIAPASLRLEITETALMDNTQRSQICLQQLKQLGVSLSIDDFGTGYSSLSYLHSFPFDVMKIDRSFVMQLLENPKSLEIVRNILLLAQNLRLQTIAEGVETELQLRQLELLNCDFGQGYWFDRPLPAEDARKRIERHLSS